MCLLRCVYIVKVSEVTGTLVHYAKYLIRRVAMKKTLATTPSQMVARTLLVHDFVVCLCACVCFPWAKRCCHYRALLRQQCIRANRMTCFGDYHKFHRLRAQEPPQMVFVTTANFLLFSYCPCGFPPDRCPSARPNARSLACSIELLHRIMNSFVIVLSGI